MNKFKLWILIQAVKIIGGSMLGKLKDLLSGKKTYLSMAGLIISALVQYSVDGDLGSLINSILIAVGGMSIRSAVDPK